VTISAPLLARYKANLAAFQGELREFCAKRGVMFMASSTTAPVEKLVLSWFRERGLVK
jgi:hypothetical protein